MVLAAYLLESNRFGDCTCPKPKLSPLVLLVTQWRALKECVCR